MLPENDLSKEDHLPQEGHPSKDHSYESGWEMNQRLKKRLWGSFLLYAAAVVAAVWALLR